MSNTSEIQQLCEKLEKLTGKKVVFAEGTWALPKSHAIADGAIRTLEAFKNKYWNLIGDDEMYDGIDSAIKRIEKLKTYVNSPENQ